MREGEDGGFATLPSAIDSMPHIEDLASRGAEPHELLDRNGGHGRSVSPQHDDRRQHSHHVSKSEQFRRLEERMDQLHEQMLATQRMVHELTQALHHKPDDSEIHEARSAIVRQNFRTLSGRALQSARGPTGLGPAGLGPSSALPIAATFLSSLSPSQSKSRSGFQRLMATTDHFADTAHKTAETRDQREAVDSVGDLTSYKTPVADRNTTARKLSATNPVALLPPQKNGASKLTVSMAVAHAATFISEITSAASAKRLQSKAPPTEPAPTPTSTHTGFGPVTSRRFSISSLDGNEHHLARGNRVSRAFQWSRNLFRPRVESAVTPEEIRDARSDYAKVHRFTIRHDSVQRMVWDTIVILMIVIDIVVTPLSLGFRYFPNGIDAYNTFANVLFASDFVVNLLSSYTTPRGVLISGPRNTIRHYLFGPWALPDFLSWFPFESLVKSDQSRFLGIAKVIRLAKMSQLARRLHSARKAGLFRFIKLLGIVFIVSHCLSCYWNWVAVDWRHMEDGYLDMPLGRRYAHCWSLVIGSLNASPPSMHSTTEEVSIAVFMLIGNVLQATVFGSVAVLIQSFDEEEVAYNKKLINTYERCRFLGIPEKLARRIQGYYENLYQETHSVDPDADAFINELSPALICEVKFQLYRDMIKQIPFLSATHINPVVIEMLILHLRTVIYMQDDVLIRKGEVGDWMGFIGSKGSVGVLDPKSETRKIIRILRKGDYFGEMALLQRSKRSTTAIALSWVQIHVLCRNDLDDVKAQYPEQAEILEQEINKYMQSKVTYK